MKASKRCVEGLGGASNGRPDICSCDILILCDDRISIGSYPRDAKCDDFSDLWLYSPPMSDIKIGMIGGSGLGAAMIAKHEGRRHVVETPFGRPSDAIIET